MKAHPRFIAAWLSLAVPATALSQSVLEFSAATYPTGETEGAVLLTVVRTGELEPAVAVDYATADGTAIGGVKYTGASGTFRLAPPGRRSQCRS